MNSTNFFNRLSLTAAYLLGSLGIVFGAEFNWVVGNVGPSPGERVVAIIDAGTISTYTGIALVGEVIDHNGNWGNTMPAKANFAVFVRFSGGFLSQLHQDVQMASVRLRLRKISNTVAHLIADCHTANRNIHVNFDKTLGSASVTLGPPNTINSAGELVISDPEYTSSRSGSLTLGSSSLAGQLAVNGNIRAKEVKVEIANWPDYVFQADYRLATLEELDRYIQVHGHLPGMPTATEADRGIDLGEMNRTLLEKVEELTLHLIAKDAEIKVLKRAQENQQVAFDLFKEEMRELINK